SADGELGPAAGAALEAAMAADPGLAQRVARHQALRARLRAALDPVLDEPLPQRLLESVRGAAAPRPAAKVIPLKRPAAPRWSWPQLGALAASLVLGALLGPLVLHPPAGGGALITRDGEMLAGGARPAATALPPSVARTLDELRAGEALDASAEAAARAHGWER